MLDAGAPMRGNAQLHAGLAALVGGALWALTPLRQPLLGAGRTAAEGEGVFRAYNASLIVIAGLLTLALVHLRQRTDGRDGKGMLVGWWTMLVGHLLLMLGSAPAVVLGGTADDLVTAGQDLGFVGAMLAALGALPLGVSALRDGRLPRVAAILFVATFPAGLLLTMGLGAMGVPEDYLGLPLTLLYGSAWVVLGTWWLAARRPSHQQVAP